MGLIDLQTNLKSLKYGKDRPGGGSSNQPYIKKPLNVDLPSSLDFLGNDFLLRGGPLGAPLSAANDVARLSKYFTDFKTPAGLLFVAKQNLLSRNAVRTEASGVLNEFIYLPTSTLAQAGINFTGLHLNKQGVNPIPGLLGSVKTYEDEMDSKRSTAVTGDTNRLVALYRVKIKGDLQSKTLNGISTLKLDKVNLLSYPGGPGSILGIGKTSFKFSTTTPSINNQGRNLKDSGFRYSSDIRSDIPTKYSQFFTKSSLSIPDNKLFMNNDPNEYIRILSFKGNDLDKNSGSNIHHAIVGDGNKEYKKGIDITDRSDFAFEGDRGRTSTPRTSTSMF